MLSLFAAPWCLWILVSCSSRPDYSDGPERSCSIPIGIGSLPKYRNATSQNQAEELGLKFHVTSVRWNEPHMDQYIWKNLGNKELHADHLRRLKDQGYVVSMTYAVVHMEMKHLPPYLKGRTWDDPYLLERWERNLRAFLEGYGPWIDYLNIGNEVNNHFSKHMEDWPAYVTFLEKSRQIIHSASPHIKMGVVLVKNKRKQFWKDIAPVCDYLAITYYTPGSVFAKSPTAEALDPTHAAYFGKTLDRVLDLAGQKPVLITEVGCASHPLLDSSPEIQAAFIKKLFGWIPGKEDKILAIAWLTLVDWPYEATKIHMKGQMSEGLINNEPFLCFLTSLGLQYEDGAPKPGYHVFREELKKYYEKSRSDGRCHGACIAIEESPSS